MRILMWFRTDLRLHDHAPLQAALELKAEVVPAYCFDPRQFGHTSFGFPKTGAFRGKFLHESVQDLRASLQELGSNLLILQGEPEVVLPQLAQDLRCDAVYYHQEATPEEVQVETALTQALDALGLDAREFWGHTLHTPEDIPFAIADLPELFTQFRKRVEAASTIYPPLPAPHSLPPLPKAALDLAAESPTLQDLGLEAPIPDPRAQWICKGGETAGKHRLQTYIWERDRLRVYKQTRNGMLNPDDSSKLSPWLALGCLSPRYIHAEVQRYEAARVQNDSTYWLIFELLWRDYFRWICKKHGNRIFRISGLRGLKLPWSQNREVFEQWQWGQTGYPLVDASMRELSSTGFMSNRGRQNVASFLTKNLGINWQMGAEWFESQLVDYDPCSNWGNWNYTAGIGNDARGFRFFNITKQAKDYDPQGEYVKHWLPELANIPSPKVHTPWQLLPVEQTRFGLELGKAYPLPMVDLWKSAKVQEQVYEKACTSQGV